MGIRQNGKLVLVNPGGEPAHAGSENWGTKQQGPLQGDYDWQVDSVAGHDEYGDGSAALPWKTIARAVSERAKFGEVQGRVTVHLRGVGPYTWVDLRGLRCNGPGARFEIRGDLAQFVVHVVATVSAVSLPTITVGVPLVAAAHQGRYLRVLTGACAGAEMPIAANTISTITVCQAAPLAEVGKLLAVGDSVAIVMPATEVFVPGGSANIINCTGGSASNTRTIVVDSTVPQLVIQGIRLRADPTGAPRLAVSASQVLMMRMHLENMSLFEYGGASVQCGAHVGTDAASYGLAAPNASPGVRLLFGAGIAVTPFTSALRVIEGSYFVGVVACTTNTTPSGLDVWSGEAKIMGCAARRAQASFNGYLHFEIGFSPAQTVNSLWNLAATSGGRVYADARVDIAGVDVDSVVVTTGSSVSLNGPNCTVQPTVTGGSKYALRMVGAQALFRMSSAPIKFQGSTPGSDIVFSADGSVASSAAFAANYGSVVGPLQSIAVRDDGNVL